MKSFPQGDTLDALTARRILAVIALVMLPGCGQDDGPVRQAGSEPEGSLRSDQRAPMPAPARTEVVGTGFFHGLAVVGGLTAEGKASAQADHYSFPTDTWRSLPPLPVALHHAGAGQLGDRLYVVGGYATVGASWAPVADVWSLGIEDTGWRKEPPLSAPRAALAVAWTGNALVAVGGVPDLVRTEILEAGATGWRRGPDLAVPREHLAATFFDGRVYAIAGRAGSLESNRDSVESWAPGEGAWRAEPKLNHSRGGIGAATVNQGGPDFGFAGGVPCVAGGEEPGDRTIPEVECLVKGAWKVVARLAVPRHGVAVAAPDRQLHVIGGGPKPGLTVSDAHEMFYF
jgi:serine/threonine-protein kinase PknK